MSCPAGRTAEDDDGVASGWRVLVPFARLSSTAVLDVSGRGTAKGLDFDVSVSRLRAPLKSSQSCGGASMPQILPGDSNSTAVWNSPVGSLGCLLYTSSPAVADAYNFDGIHSIVDIAGGHGLLLATILKRNPQLRGTLFDMPHVIEGAKNGPLKSVMERCTLASGDMFSSVPAGADAYIMKHIIHDWKDDRCIQILKACRKSVNSGGRLLVVDNVIQPGNDFSPAKFLDLQMLIFPSGCERTEKQFRDLFAAAGWKLTRITPTVAADSIVEGVPA